MAKSEHYNRVMPALLVLTLLPLVLQLYSMWQAGKHREVLIISITMLISAVASVSLFMYGTDWTRWIYIHAFSLMLLLVFIAPRRFVELHRDKAPSFAVLGGGSARHTVTAIVLLAYVFAWHLSLYQPRVPFGGLIHYLLKTYKHA